VSSAALKDWKGDVYLVHFCWFVRKTTNNDDHPIRNQFHHNFRYVSCTI